MPRRTVGYHDFYTNFYGHGRPCFADWRQQVGALLQAMRQRLPHIASGDGSGAATWGRRM
jgi:hypothetical protein